MKTRKDRRAWARLAVVAFFVALSGCSPSRDGERMRQTAIDSKGRCSMAERPDVVTMKGDPITLIGKAVAVGDKARPFTLTGNELKDVTLDQYAGKVLVISVVPSLDTGVCAVQTRTFNEKATDLSGDVAILTVSMDLPFAQKRFCGAEGIDRVETASDYKHRTFGTDYGVLIKELGLHARAVFVVDRDGTIVHSEYVPEVGQEPDYASAMQAVKAAL